MANVCGVDYKKEFIKLSVENFVSKNSLKDYFMYQGRVVGTTPEASKVFIDFIVLMATKGVSGLEVAEYMSERYFVVGE